MSDLKKLLLSAVPDLKLVENISAEEKEVLINILYKVRKNLGEEK